MRRRHVKPQAAPVQPAPQGQAFYDLLASKIPKEKTDYHYTPNGVTQTTTTILAIRHKPVAWGIPLDEVIFSKWFVNFLGLDMMPWDTFITTESTYLPEARNAVHEAFHSSGLEWLVMLDSDVMPPKGFLKKLLSAKKQMIGGWYKRKVVELEKRYPVVYDFNYTDSQGIPRYAIRKQPGSGLEKVDAAGAGAWLMHRAVAVALGPKPYDLYHGGEDLDLCKKVHEAGFEVWIDWDLSCGHAGVFEY